jgi:hypothetical protein
LSVSCDRSVVFSTNKTDLHDITDILLKVALSTTDHTHGEMYWIQHYVIKFVSVLWQVCGFNTWCFIAPDHRHELKFLIPITLLDMTTITVIDYGMSLSVLYIRRNLKNKSREWYPEIEKIAREPRRVHLNWWIKCK